MNCIFCEIAAGNIKADVVSTNDRFFVLKDLNPQAPVHLLVIPSKHHANLAEAAGSDSGLLSELLSECARLGQELGGENGYRVVINSGNFGGQTVNHLHCHVLAGRMLNWPPG